MAVLSTHWNDAWLQHGRLAFDSDFLHTLEQCYESYDDDDEGITLVNIINNILFFRAGPVKKFTLQISSDHPQPQQTDFDRWCLFLSRNGVEELNISLASCVEEYKLPFCLLSCRTIKQLIVHALLIDLPVNVVRIFFNVTSLAFFALQFKRSVNGIASTFRNCNHGKIISFKSARSLLIEYVLPANAFLLRKVSNRTLNFYTLCN
nr:F-box/FBD/LRR-repeat protein At1g13570-like [Ipomoea batatas]